MGQLKCFCVLMATLQTLADHLSSLSMMLAGQVSSLPMILVTASKVSFVIMIIAEKSCCGVSVTQY